MPGFNPAPLAYRAENANDVVVLIGDQPIAFAQNVTHRIGFGNEVLYGVGSAKPQEIQQLKIGPEVTLDNFALTSLGSTLIQGGTNFASIIANNQFNFCVANANGTVLYTYVGCVARDFSETIAANRPITDAITFDAMDVLDQTGQSILSGPNAFTIASNQGNPVNGGLGISVNGGLGISVNGGLGISVTASL
jgi:hypothetical protein